MLRELRDLELACLRKLRVARFLADDDTGRLARDRVEDLRPPRLELGGSLVAGEALERARDHVRLACERSLDRLELVADLEPHAEGTQPFDEPGGRPVR